MPKNICVQGKVAMPAILKWVSDEFQMSFRWVSDEFRINFKNLLIKFIQINNIYSNFNTMKVDETCLKSLGMKRDRASFNTIRTGRNYKCTRNLEK